MVILYFDNAHHEYYHGVYYRGWTDFNNWRAGEGAWLVPGTDPEDCFYA